MVVPESKVAVEGPSMSVRYLKDVISTATEISISSVDDALETVPSYSPNHGCLAARTRNRQHNRRRKPPIRRLSRRVYGYVNLQASKY